MSSSFADIVSKHGAAARGLCPRAAQIFIGILYLSPRPRLEPLWPSGPYSSQAKRSGRRDRSRYGGSFSWNFWLASSWRQIQAEARTNTMDIVVIGIDVLFFALSLAYIRACDAL
ncbi:hypothetical protein FJV76_30865 [Mesorhizobium sp. WSM4303]|nr:hypothetical protein FJV77_23735 [Mesorhizobium sp. WSM4306]TRC94229.1 hypothetical protein FJV76_30865 [Mesorhizobium sp. WSM4303]